MIPVSIESAIPTFLIARNGSWDYLEPNKSGENKEGNKEPFNSDITVPSRDEFEMPEWVIENAKLGYLGEQIAKIYLQSNFLKVKIISQQSSRKGYDITADDQFFEIKTSSVSSGFDITSHELAVAETKKNDYWIFFIFINKLSRTAKGYLIKNPMKRFDILYKELVKPHIGGKVVISPNGFRVNLEEFIVGHDQIDLSEIYKKIDPA